MNLNPFELVNVFISIGLLSILRHRRDSLSLMMALFVCGTFHYSFAVFALLSSDSSRLLTTMHNEGSGLLASFSTLAVLIVAFGILGQRAYEAYSMGIGDKGKSRRVALFIIFVMVALLVGYLLNYRAGDRSQLINVMSVMAMLLLVMLAYLSLSGNLTLNFSWLGISLFVLGVIVAIAAYEVWSYQSWSWFQNSSGEVVYRASSVLFNPNLFGFWASFVYIASAYGMHAHWDRRRSLLLGMMLASCAVYLSGSRSSAALLLGVLVLSAALTRGRRQWAPLVVLPATILIVYTVSALFDSNPHWRAITVLGERFAEAPLHLANYVLRFFDQGVDVPPEVEISIEGRFIGEGMDAGWLVLYQDTGWVGQMAVFLVAALILARAMYLCWARPGPASAYSLGLLLYCLLTGLVMRFQVFPVWLFTGLAFVIFLVRSRLAIRLPKATGG
ncbi:hypothetical protein [Denitromonas sp.]|uniref:hypothetical protein n=1 Tax=Denitromonas sp. TaxID=2734609 RepID=UPI002AFF7D51|nr:hypothetical protein [Denitromonas sp.]